MRVYRWVEQPRGATLIEILVAIVLAAVLGLAAGGAVVFASRSWLGAHARLETQQNLRMAVERMARQLRLAGACLPIPGNEDLQALRGRNNGDRDDLRVRLNIRCAVTTIRDQSQAGHTTIQVENVQGFVPGTDAYILGSNGFGEYVHVEGVSGQTVTLAGGLRRSYAAGAAVYGAEEQLYQIQERDGVPMLMLTIGPALEREPELLARGIEALDVQYVLNRRWRQEECAGAYPLDSVELCMVDEPTSQAEWALVRVVRVTVRARSVRPVPGIGPWSFYRLEETFDVKPRNLLKQPPQE